MSDRRKKHLFYVLLLICLAGMIPFFFVGRENQMVMGIPLWLCVSALFTVGLSILTTWGVLTLWKDEGHD